MELCQNKVIDLGFCPRVLGCGWRWIGQWLEGPKGAVAVGDLHREWFAAIFDEEWFVIRGAQSDPLLEVGDEGVGELCFLGWHFRLLLVAEKLEKVALGWLLEIDGVIGFATFEEEFAGGQVETGAGFFVTVALEAVVDQSGADRLLKEVRSCLHSSGVVCRKGVSERRGRKEDEGESVKQFRHIPVTLSHREGACTV